MIKSIPTQVPELLIPARPPATRQPAIAFEALLANPPDDASPDPLPPKLEAATAGSLPTPDAPEAPVVVEFGLRPGAGTVEALSVLWRISGSHRLSQLTVDLTLTDASTHSARYGAEPALRPSRHELNVSPLIPAAGRATPFLPAIMATFIGAAGARSAAQVAARAAMEQGTLPSPVPAAEPWLARLLRWVDGGQGSASVWIRDYHQDGTTLQSTVDGLRDWAKEHGHQLTRIVVNGHEYGSRAPTSERKP